MAITTLANMQIVPEKFSKYVIDRTTELSTLVKSGIATPDAMAEQLINGVPAGGSFIQLPMYNPLNDEEDILTEDDLSVGGITTKVARATLLMRGKAWGTTMLSHVLGGSDPMAAIADQLVDWRTQREQKIFLSILKGIFAGALKEHCNDISTMDGTASYISDAATLDTKQVLGDHYGSLGMVFMHSAVYTYLQKNGMITRNPIFDPSQSSVEMERYLGYTIKVDDGMPVTDGVYDTYFVGKGAFIRQDGTPAGFVGTETDRDKLGGKDFLINRWCQVIHPRGLSWLPTGDYANPQNPTPANVDLEKAENWELVVDHKKVPLACLKHKIG